MIRFPKGDQVRPRSVRPGERALAMAAIAARVAYPVERAVPRMGVEGLKEAEIGGESLTLLLRGEGTFLEGLNLGGGLAGGKSPLGVLPRWTTAAYAALVVSPRETILARGALGGGGGGIEEEAAFPLAAAE